jgi:hypothetical protein
MVAAVGQVPLSGARAGDISGPVSRSPPVSIENGEGSLAMTAALTTDLTAVALLTPVILLVLRGFLRPGRASRPAARA